MQSELVGNGIFCKEGDFRSNISGVMNVNRSNLHMREGVICWFFFKFLKTFGTVMALLRKGCFSSGACVLGLAVFIGLGISNCK